VETEVEAEMEIERKKTKGRQYRRLRERRTVAREIFLALWEGHIVQKM
jgi:hypothetical protein